jgi:hypothetical protein
MLDYGFGQLRTCEEDDDDEIDSPSDPRPATMKKKYVIIPSTYASHKIQSQTENGGILPIPKIPRHHRRDSKTNFQHPSPPL